MDFGYHRADQIIVHGKLLKRQVQEELGIASDKIHVISHIVMGERSRDLHVPEQRNLLLFFGRIWEYKGLEYLIRAEPLISQHIPDVRILIAGKGDDMERYRRMMVHPERFEIVNEFVSNEQREIFFEQASVIVLPYINATQSGVVPIAYTHAKPVVATRVGSLQEFVDDGETGFLVYPRDEHALAAAVVKLLANDSLRREMGQRGRAKLDAECAPQVVADKHREVYEVAIAGKANRCKS
jgi:glycosyltransferase involved in cell wall biosynthesis